MVKLLMPLGISGSHHRNSRVQERDLGDGRPLPAPAGKQEAQRQRHASLSGLSIQDLSDLAFSNFQFLSLQW